MSNNKPVSFVERLRKRQLQKPTIGFVFTTERSDNSHDPQETSYSVRFRENLPKTGTGCDMQIIDFHTMMEEFKASHPDGYKEMEKNFSASKIDGDGVKHAPNLDVTTGAGKKLRDFLAQHPAINKLDGIAGPGDYYNAIGDNVNPSPHRMYFEKALYDIAKDKGLPVVGVCGTEQHIAYFAGADISQDVEKLTGDSHTGRDTEGRPSGDVIAHYIIVKQGTALHSMAIHADPIKLDDGSAAAQVNSLHTQAVFNNEATRKALKQANLEISAVDVTKKIVEAIEGVFGAPVTLLQSHPEYLNSAFEDVVMSSLIEAAQTYQNKKALQTEVKSSWKDYVRNTESSQEQLECFALS